MRTSPRPGPQGAFGENVREFPDGGNQANARRFAIAKAAIIKAVRADKHIPARNRASVQNYVSLAADHANRLIFNRTGYLVFWIGLPTAIAILGCGRDTIMRCRRILEDHGYTELLEPGQRGRGCSNLQRLRIPSDSAEPMPIDAVSWAKNVARECGRKPAKMSRHGTYYGSKNVPSRDMNPHDRINSVLREEDLSDSGERAPYGASPYPDPESEDPGFGLNQYSAGPDFPDDYDQDSENTDGASYYDPPPNIRTPSTPKAPSSPARGAVPARTDDRSSWTPRPQELPPTGNDDIYWSRSADAPGGGYWLTKNGEFVWQPDRHHPKGGTWEEGVPF